jgi:hypothetical protein
MKKILLSTLAICCLQTLLHAQTKGFEVYAVAEGNFGTPNGDVFKVTKGRDTAIATSLPLYQTANNTGGFDVIQDFEVTGNKAVFGTKAGNSRIVVANFPSFDSVHIFSGLVGAGTQCMGKASATKVYLSTATGSIIRQLDLLTNTLNQVIDPANSIGSSASHMVQANGSMYVAMAARIVKIDTITNTVTGVIQPGLGTISGLQYDTASRHLWILGKSGGVSSVIRMDVMNNDFLNTPIVFTGLTNATMLRYCNQKLYLLAGKSVHIYNIQNPNIPTSPVYTSTLGGSASGFAYGKAFNVDPVSGDFTIGHANGYASSSLFEVVDGSTFTVIGKGAIEGCRIVNELMLKTFVAPALPVPVIDPLPVVKAQCSATVTAPTAMSGSTVITGTTTDSLHYSRQGTYTITWMYSNAGGSVTQTQQVIVADTIAPVPDVVSLPALTVACPYTITALPTATDNCLGAIVGTTTDSLTYTVAGAYTITWTYTDSNANSTTQTQRIEISCNPSGITGPSKNGFTCNISPNPASDLLTFDIKNGNASAVHTLSFRDMMGKEILRTQVNNTHFSVPVGHLPAAVYFVTIQQNGTDHTTTQRIVIRH